MTDFPHRPARIWEKISLQVPLELADGVAAGLYAITGNGVEFPGHQATAGELQTLIGYINSDADQADTQQRVLDFLRSLGLSATVDGPEGPRLDVLQEEDWGATWKEKFKPIRIGSRLIVRPPWEEIQPAADQVVVTIDPGMAFGTGLHATTQLALELIETSFGGPGRAPERVLDVGTGTGILAIAGALFGAHQVTATDLDPDAVHAAQENSRLNGVDKQVTVQADDIADLAPPFDLVIANITHDVLSEMAPQLNRLLAPGGRLIVTGLLHGWQTDSLSRILADLGLNRCETRFRDEWTALYCTKGTV